MQIWQETDENEKRKIEGLTKILHRVLLMGVEQLD